MTDIPVASPAIQRRGWRTGSFGSLAEILCALATCLLIACLVSNAVLNMFYLDGAMTDAIQFSTLAWRNGWHLDLPSGVAPGTFFNTHISWFFWFPSALSYLLPAGRIAFFSWFTGCLHALLGLGLWLALRELWPDRRPFTMLLKCLAAAGFALNGHSQSLLSQAHQEIAGPAFTLIFLWGLFRGKPRVALLSFVLALSQREDMGFDIFGLLFLVLALDWRRRVPREQWKPVMIYAAAAFGYGLAAVAVQHLAFDEWGIFRMHYAGVPPFAHVSPSLLAERLKILLAERPWIWGPGLVAALWAVEARNPYILAAWLSCVPWLALNLMAKLDLAGALGLHYGFPFLIAGGWPILAASSVFTGPRGLRSGRPAYALAWTVALVMIQQPVAIYPRIGFASSWLRLTPVPKAISTSAYETFERKLPEALTEMSNVRADDAAFGIAPYAFTLGKHRIKTRALNPVTAELEEFTEPEKGIDSVFYFTEAYDRPQVTALIRANGLRNHYRLPGTRLYLATSADITDIPALVGVFVLAIPEPVEPLDAVK